MCYRPYFGWQSKVDKKRKKSNQAIINSKPCQQLRKPYALFNLNWCLHRDILTHFTVSLKVSKSIPSSWGKKTNKTICPVQMFRLKLDLSYIHINAIKSIITTTHNCPNKITLNKQLHWKIIGVFLRPSGMIFPPVTLSLCHTFSY